MSLVALDGTPLITVGAPTRVGDVSMAALASAGLTLGSCLTSQGIDFYGHVFTEDGASHTIDNTGASALGWMTGAVTFNSTLTFVYVGLSNLSTTLGPPARSGSIGAPEVGVRYDGGGGGITANAWQESVPSSGTKTIANGDFVCFEIYAAVTSSLDAIIVNCEPAPTATVNVRPGVTTKSNIGTYTGRNALPNAVITFSDGVKGFFWGGWVASIGLTTQTWNNTSATVEYGNFFQMPVPTKIYGIIATATLGKNADMVLYSDPLGTPVAEKTVSVDLHQVGAANATGYQAYLFSSPYTTTANQPLAAIMSPTSTGSISGTYKTYNSSAHQKSEVLGVNGYAVNRTAVASSVAFAAQNSNKDRFSIGLLVGAFDTGGGGTSGGGGFIING